MFKFSLKFIKMMADLEFYLWPLTCLIIFLTRNILFISVENNDWCKFLIQRVAPAGNIPSPEQSDPPPRKISDLCFQWSKCGISPPSWLTGIPFWESCLNSTLKQSETFRSGTGLPCRKKNIYWPDSAWYNN